MGSSYGPPCSKTCTGFKRRRNRENQYQIRLSRRDEPQKDPLKSAKTHKTLSLDLATDILNPEFLAQFASADKRFVTFAEGGKRKLKISGDNANSVTEILRLYAALVEDSGPHNKAPTPKKK